MFASDLIWQQAIVSRDRQRSWAEFSRLSACSRCLAGNGCGAGLFAMFFAGRSARFAMPDGHNFQTGDRIRIGIQPEQLLLASVVLYLFPLLCFMLGLAMAEWLLNTVEVISLLIAICVAGAGLILIRRWQWVPKTLVIEPLLSSNERCLSGQQKKTRSAS